jgi:PAS domain S-box-containing protein
MRKGGSRPRNKAYSKRDIRITKRNLAEKEREDQFRLVEQFENLPILAYHSSPTGKILDCNKMAVKTLGYRGKRELIGKPLLTTVYAQSSREKARKLLLKLKKTERLSNEELQIITKQGKVIDVLLNAHVFYDQKGKPLYRISTQLDITERKQMEENLRKSEATYRRLFESSQEGIAILDADTKKIIDANPFMQRLSALSLEQLLGKQLWEIESFRDVGTRIDFKELLKSRFIRIEPFSIEVKEKGSVSIGIVSTFYEVNGRKVIQCNIHDITELIKLQQKLEQHVKHLEELVEARTRVLRESEEKYRTLMMTSPDAVIVYDLEGRITGVSDQTLELYGFSSAEELLGRNTLDLIAPEDREKAMINLQRTIKERIIRDIECAMLRTDETRFSAELNATVIKDAEGTPKAFMVAARDITERKRMSELRNRLISAVTHELRTPLISVKGYVDYILSGKLGSMAEKVESSLKVVQRNTDVLLQLVNDLLDIQRLEHRSLEFNVEPLNLRKLVEECIENRKYLNEQREQSWKLEVSEDELPVVADRIRLRQVLMNIMDNAGKFTPEGGKVTIRADMDEEHVKIQISDTGIGIRKEDLERVFVTFAAVEKPTYFKGTGLGMSVSKGLIEAQGGRMWSESAGEGKGATFILVLPRKKGVD